MRGPPHLVALSVGAAPPRPPAASAATAEGEAYSTPSASSASSRWQPKAAARAGRGGRPSSASSRSAPSAPPPPCTSRTARAARTLCMHLPSQRASKVPPRTAGQAAPSTRNLASDQRTRGCTIAPPAQWPVCTNKLASKQAAWRRPPCGVRAHLPGRLAAAHQPGVQVLSQAAHRVLDQQLLHLHTPQPQCAAR